MTILTETPTSITIGVDTHSQTHVAAILDQLGRLIDTAEFEANESGYTELISWATQQGQIEAVGIEGTGSWGLGLTRHAQQVGITCFEVNHPNRQHRRRHGKSDTTDAIGAARAVQSGEASGQPRGNNGICESLRTTRLVLRSAIKSRTQAINQLRSLINAAPEAINSQFTSRKINSVIETAAAFRCGNITVNAATTMKRSMRSLARRINYLNTEITELRRQQETLVNHAAPQLLDQRGFGPAVTADILIAFGDNPGRIVSEASFAALCGVSPIDCSSGLQQHHRLNRGGDRQANNALWRIVMVRLSCDSETKAFMAKQQASGKSKRHAIRSLKRHIARSTWRLLQEHPPRLDNQ